MKTHAIKFEIITTKNDIYCYFEIEGDLRHEDYEVFVPAFEKALENIKEPKVKLLADIRNLKSWDLHAAWDDLKFGLKHGNEFSKVAVLGNSKVYEYGTKISNWFIPSSMKYFESLEDAKKWLLD